MLILMLYEQAGLVEEIIGDTLESMEVGTQILFCEIAINFENIFNSRKD